MASWGRILLLIPSAIALAQPRFDVASVKPSPPSPGDTININLGTASHGTVTLTNTTLSECLRYAYGLVGEEQIAGPDWMRDRHFRYDIIAKAPPSTPPDQLLLMMQSLLTERFRLQLHREPRRVPHLELTVAKNGPKMTESPGEGQSVRQYYGRGRLQYLHMTMPRLAVLLARQLHEPVLDRTGLTPAFDIDLRWTPEDLPPGSPPPDPDAPPYPDIYAAIQQQLGLKLEPAKGPLEVIVIDHAEKTPVEN